MRAGFVNLRKMLYTDRVYKMCLEKGMRDYLKESAETLVPFYQKTPIAVRKGCRHWVWDVRWKRYLDFTAGIAVVNFGHANRKINRAVSRQMSRITHISNLFVVPRQAEFARLIMERAFPGKVFFCNSGAEANETALKIARIAGNRAQADKNVILALQGSFHGRTIATISLTGQDKYRKGFEPLLQKIEFVEPNNVKMLRKKMTSQVCAIFLEAVQGEGGIVRLSDEFVAEAANGAKKKGALLVFDEIQAGMGRTGRYFGYQNFKVQPDIITLAKALGNGFPVGAVLVRKSIADRMPAGIHASTFGGNYAACAAGIASLKQLDKKMLLHIRDMSAYFRKKLEDMKAIFPAVIEENRIYGLMIGIQIKSRYEVRDLIGRLVQKRILALRAGENVLRLMPPFTVDKSAIDLFCRKLYEVLSELG